MSNIIIFALIILLLVVIFYGFEFISKTRWFRIRSILREHEKAKKREAKNLKEIKKESTEFLKDENKIERILEKIHKGEDVEIPLVAFDFIYRNINKISVLSDDGKIKIVEKQKYSKFQNIVTILLHKKRN